MREPSQWYLKRENATSGPYPQAAIESQVVLGRIGPNDELSNDGKQWQTVGSMSEFSSQLNFDRSSREFAKFDERSAERRNRAAAGASDTAQTERTSDRRRTEAPSVVTSRQKSNQIWQSLQIARERRVGLWLALTAIIVFLFAIAPFKGAEVPVVLNCESPPAIGVNWESCNLSNIDLRHLDLREAQLANAKFESSNFAGALAANANLAYANLSNANLHLANFTQARVVGAKLVGANLSYANFSGADLRYSDLTNARIDGAEFSDAKLGGAIWMDGVRCKPGSVGRCARGGLRD